MNGEKLRSTFPFVLIALAETNRALGQDAEAEARAEAEGDVGMGLPGPAAAPPRPRRVAVNAGATDHNRVVGRLGVGFLGRESISLGGPDAPGGTGEGVISAPVIGIRYWLSQKLGVDAGLGFAYETGSVTADPGADTDNPSRWAFVIHGGVPLALAGSRHFTFELVPELNLGFGASSLPDVDHRGFLLDLGARAGAEIQFGFIGVPELSLQASVGVLFAWTRGSSDQSAPGAVDTSETALSFRSTLGDDPWDLFAGNVSALYYF